MKNLHPKPLTTRPSRHCSWGRRPRFPHLAPGPHPSNHRSETASSHPVPYSKTRSEKRSPRHAPRHARIHFPFTDRAAPGSATPATENPDPKPPRGGQAAAVAGHVSPGFHPWPTFPQVEHSLLHIVQLTGSANIPYLRAPGRFLLSFRSPVLVSIAKCLLF